CASLRPTSPCPTTSSSSASRSPLPSAWSPRRAACSTSTDRGHQRLYGSALPHHGGRARSQVAQAGRRRREDGRDAGRGRDRQGGDGPGRARGRRAAAGGGGRGADGTGGERGGRHRGAGRERQRSVGHSPACAGGKGETGNGKRGRRDCPRTEDRRAIAERLATSLGPIPHCFLTAEVDMERASEARDGLNKQLGDRGKVSFNDIVSEARALALGTHRACNAWFQEDHVRYWNEVHIGMAVAVEDGLITPVIRSADLKSLGEIGREAKDLAEKARNRRLQPNEYTGATFSVSNLGMFDIDQFTAVINPPEAGIIAVGSIVQKPVVLDGQVTARRRVRLTMSCDHRVIDGATGAAFLQTLKQMLENPLAMLL